jgi:tagatose 6-phosphate kinase
VILCICPSPAIDVTYHVDRLRAGSTTRVRVVTERPGGKGVNVARVLHRLGEPVRLVVPAGGDTGHELSTGLEEAGLEALVVADGNPTRRTVTVVDESAGTATTLVEPARLDSWPDLLEAAERALSGSDVLVISGSLPRGVPDDGVAALVERGRHRGVPVVVDTHGPALLAALAAGPTVVKPNLQELADVTGAADPVRAARDLAHEYGVTVVVSLGERGVVLASASGCWDAHSPTVTGNPTGAGDAFVAGLARALRGDPRALESPEAVLRDSVALGAAAVLSPEAGDVDPDHHVRQLPAVVVHPRDSVR